MSDAACAACAGAPIMSMSGGTSETCGWSGTIIGGAIIDGAVGGGGACAYSAVGGGA